MIIDIHKNTPAKKIKNILKKIMGKKPPQNSLDSFFGKLPGIEDGLTYQKKVRNGWK